jgi:hypothetical protein
VFVKAKDGKGCASAVQSVEGNALNWSTRKMELVPFWLVTVISTTIL